MNTGALPSALCWLVALLIGVACFRAPAAPATLLTTQAIQDLPIKEANSYMHARIRGVVTFSSESLGYLFVEDETGGIYCEHGPLKAFPPLGQILELDGFTTGGSFLPVIDATSIRDLGPGKLPAPRPARLRDLFAGRYDADFVRVGALVVTAELPRKSDQHLHLNVADGPLLAEVEVYGFQSTNISNLPGAWVQIDGVFAPQANESRQVVAVALLAGSESQLRIVTNSTEVVSAIPVSTPSQFLEIADNSRAVPALEAVRIRGIVSVLGSSEAWITDGSQGVGISIATGNPLKLGDEVDVLAQPRMVGAERAATYIRLIESRPGAPLKPERRKAVDLYDWEHYGAPLTTDAEFLHRIPSDDGDILVLREGDRTFDARLMFGPSERAKHLAGGSRLRVSGTLQLRAIDTEVPASPRILIASQDALQVLTRQPWPLERTLTVVTALLVLLLGILFALMVNTRRLRDSNRKVAEAERELRELNSDLGRRIHSRTAELEHAIQRLNAEVVERRNAQEALADRESRLKDAQSIAHIGSFHWNASTGRVIWSDELYRIYGLRPESFSGTFSDYLNRIHPEDRDTIAGIIQRAYTSEQDFRHDYRICRPEGEVRWVSSVGRITRDPSGKPVGMEGTCQDVTERKRSEAVLQTQARVLELIAKDSPVEETLDLHLRAVESQAEGLFTSILLLDEEGLRLTPIAGPSIPAEYSRQLIGFPIGPSQGSCGTAVHRKAQVIVSDIATDPLWDVGRHIALPFGFRACWSSPIRDSLGKVLGTFAVYYKTPRSPDEAHIRLIESATDTAAICITRARANRELQESEAALRRAQSMAHVGSWTFDVAHKRFIGSEEANRICGGSGGSMTDAELASRVHPDDYDRVLAAWRVLVEGGSLDMEHRLVIAGEVRWVHARAQCELDDTGKAVRVNGVTQDITKRKRIDEAVRALGSSTTLGSGQEFFPGLARQLAEVFQTRYAVVAEWSESTPEIFVTLGLYGDGKTLPNFQRPTAGSPCERVIHGANAQFSSRVRELFPDDTVMQQIGAESYFGLPVYDNERRVIGIVAVIHDHPLVPTPEQEPILRMFADRAGVELERHRSLAALREAEARFRSAIEHSHEGLALTDREGHCTYISPSVTSILGFLPTELAGKPTFYTVVPDDAVVIAEHQRRVLEKPGAHAQAEFRVRGKDGSERWIQTSDTNQLDDPVLQSVVSNFRDITERKASELAREQLESQLRHSQKMEAIGTLAGGIAHDFNNILAAIIGCADLALLDVGNNPGVREGLHDILAASRRAKDLVKQILTFSRRQDQRRHPVNLAPIVQESVRLLRAALPASIGLELNISKDTPDVLAEPTQIQQVILNLVTNAAAAIGHRPGTIRIILARTNVDPSNRSRAQHVRPGPAVRLAVEDNGPGIEPAHIDRIFEPFFTTKGPGQGTGLGLSVVHGIIRSHEGDITVHSQLGAGAQFEILLPTAVPHHPVPHLPAPVSAPQGGSLRRGTEHILVVDDEPALLSVVSRILKGLGYRVTPCSNPAEALEKFHAAPFSFDLVLTDYSMPGQDGVALAQELHSQRPELPIIIATGHGRGLTREAALDLGFREMLEKPVGLQELSATVRNAIEGKVTAVPVTS